MDDGRRRASSYVADDRLRLSLLGGAVACVYKDRGSAQICPGGSKLEYFVKPTADTCTIAKCGFTSQSALN